MLSFLVFVLCLPVSIGGSDSPFCRSRSRLRGPFERGAVDQRRMFVIGDIHGDYEGLTEILKGMDILEERSEDSSCAWNTVIVNTTIIQMGDVVDRGTQTTEAFECLNQLQGTQSNGNVVIRLLGNHELLWLESIFDFSNKQTDTMEIKSTIVKQLNSSILSGKIQGAYATSVQGLPLLFSHAGLRPDMLRLIRRQIRVSHPSIEELAQYINERLVLAVLRCQKISMKTSSGASLLPLPLRCNFQDEIFQAGPERGGIGIGGSYWTDFDILMQTDEDPLHNSPFLQIVGHSIAVNKIRITRGLSAVCVDAGMYLGGRAYLEITRQGNFVAHSRQKKVDYQAPAGTKVFSGYSWQATDLTALYCS